MAILEKVSFMICFQLTFDKLDGSNIVNRWLPKPKLQIYSPYNYEANIQVPFSNLMTVDKG